MRNPPTSTFTPPTARPPAPFTVSAISPLSRLSGGILLATALLLGGCARVHQKDREFLSDPIMQLTPDLQGAGLESHNLPRREGSAGGSSGSGGGCGC